MILEIIEGESSRGANQSVESFFTYQGTQGKPRRLEKM